MQLVLVQPDVAWEDRGANFARVTRLLEDSPPQPRALIILPEMFAVGFSMNVAAVGEDVPGPTEHFLRELARGHEAFVVGGLVTRAPGGKGRNEALAIGPDGEVLARYTKLHPFSFGGEADHYQPGDDVVTFDWDGLMAAPFICYDLRFPEVYRRAVVGGAQLLVTIANFPSSRVHHWRSLLVARAIENQAFVAGVNRCGADPNLEYPGASMVVDPRGDVLAEAGVGEQVLSVEIAREDVSRCREAFPFLRDMRGDMVGRST